MKIANGVEMLELSLLMMGRPSVIYPTLIWEKDGVILVDTGYPGPTSLGKLREEMQKLDMSFDKLSRIIITHQDLDHIGGLPLIVNETGQNVEVVAHEEEKPYIQGDKKLVKLTDEAIARLDVLPEEQRRAFKAVFEKPPSAKVDKIVSDGEELPYGEGVVVIHTPGHTPGHICLYLKQSKILVAGDVLNVVDGQLFGPMPQHTSDMNTALESLKKLTRYDIEAVISYHGGFFKDNVNQRIAELARGNLGKNI